VVLYHIGLPLHGGYVGVDIFFTISGFLIGSILLRETAEQRFSFAAFYERRIRRIFPALFAMLFVTGLLACRYMLPSELIDFAKSMAAAACSFSNLYFWSQSGYFDAPASMKPLLHTWSLAVEEQFYILFPILLVLLRSWLPRRLDTVIYTLAAASFAIAAYGAFYSPSTTFYWPHTRAWELLIGAILALKSCPQIRRPATRQIAGLVGLVSIGAPLFLYSPITPFPGIAALPPCLGTALIIAAGRSGPNVAGRVLSLKPVRFIGLISYSLYLWHWPVIVFHQLGLTLINGLGKHPTELLLFGVSFLLAVLSWRFVEVPFRDGPLRVARLALFTGAAIAFGTACIASAGIVASQGLPSRFSPEARKVAWFLEYDQHESGEQYRNGQCFIASPAATFADFHANACLPAIAGKKQWLLVGDSHAAALWWGLSHVFPGVNVMQANGVGCKPVLQQRPRQFATCTAIMNFVLRDYLATHKVDAVLLAAHWDDGDLPSVAETLTFLHQQHIPVVLIGPIVQYDSALPRFLALGISHGDSSLAARHRLQYVEPLDEQMGSLARSTGTPYLSLYRLFCFQNRCDECAKPGVPLQFDYGHLTKEGSILAAQRAKSLHVLPQ
jgi:peptidoglycan/LPS O-acetylase OafA/YrhL